MEPQQTLHSWTQAFWRDLPLPIAELGAQIEMGSPRHLETLFSLSEATSCMATAIGLGGVRQRRDWSVHAPSVAGFLRRAALGHRVALVEKLDELEPRACGWELAEPLFGCERLLDATGVATGRRAPTVRDVLKAVVEARNIPAHPSSGRNSGADLVAMWEEALGALLGANQAMTRPLLWIAEVRKEPGGGWAYRAQSLSGPIARPYRKGQPQLTHQELEPHAVYLKTREDALELLEPFVTSDDGARAFIIGEIKARPVLWRPGTGARYERDVCRDFDDALPGWRNGEASVPSPVLRSPSPRATAAPISSPSWSQSQPIWQRMNVAVLGAVAVGVLVTLATLLVIVLVGRPGSESNESESAAPGAGPVLAPTPPAATARTCWLTMPSGPVSQENAAAFLTGMDLRFGDSVVDFESRCGRMPRKEPLPCVADILDWLEPVGNRGAIPGGEHLIAFDRNEGLFEILVTTTRSREEIEQLVSARVTGAVRVDDDPLEWRWGATTGLRVRTARRGSRRTVVKLWDVQRSEPYWQQRRTECSEQ